MKYQIDRALYLNKIEILNHLLNFSDYIPHLKGSLAMRPIEEIRNMQKNTALSRLFL